MKPFISVDEAYKLSQKDEATIFVDIRHNIYDLGQGLRSYQENHLPRAIFIDLHTELSGEKTENTGRHPLPTITEFKAMLQKYDFKKDSRIICYDDVGGGYAARLWFMLETLGFESVQILEGGITQWLKEGYPVTTEASIVKPAKDDLKLHADWSEGKFEILNFEKVEELVNSGFSGLIDARNPERFRGEESGPDPVGGHIPNAANRWWMANIDDNKLLRDKKELKNEFDLFFTNAKPEESVLYCGSGVTACFNFAVLKELDFKDPKIYVGGFSDWIKHTDKIETK